MKKTIVIILVLILLGYYMYDNRKCQINGTVSYDTPKWAKALIWAGWFLINNDNTFCVTKKWIKDANKFYKKEYSSSGKHLSYNELRKTYQSIGIMSKEWNFIWAWVIFPKESEVELSYETTAAEMAKFMYRDEDLEKMKEKYQAIVNSDQAQVFGEEIKDLVKKKWYMNMLWEDWIKDAFLTFKSEVPEIIKE